MELVDGDTAACGELIYELAEELGMDSGHMSRILGQMHGYGFLREEKDRLRVYYQTDREAIHNFLEMVENTIFSS